MQDTKKPKGESTPETPKMAPIKTGEFDKRRKELSPMLKRAKKIVKKDIKNV